MKMTVIESHCCKFGIASYHQPFPDSYKIRGLLLSLQTERSLVFSNLTWWSCLIQSVSQLKLKSIELYHEALSKAHGDSVGFSAKNVFVKDVHCGNTVGNSQNGTPMEAAGFTIQVIIMNHPSSTSVGCVTMVDCHTPLTTRWSTKMKGKLMPVLVRRCAVGKTICCARLMT